MTAIVTDLCMTLASLVVMWHCLARLRRGALARITPTTQDAPRQVRTSRF